MTATLRCEPWRQAYQVLVSWIAARSDVTPKTSSGRPHCISHKSCMLNLYAFIFTYCKLSYESHKLTRESCKPIFVSTRSTIWFTKSITWHTRFTCKRAHVAQSYHVQLHPREIAVHAASPGYSEK